MALWIRNALTPGPSPRRRGEKDRGDALIPGPFPRRRGEEDQGRDGSHPLPPLRLRGGGQGEGLPSVGARFFAPAAPDLTPGPSPQAERGERQRRRLPSGHDGSCLPRPHPRPLSPKARGGRSGPRWFASTPPSPFTGRGSGGGVAFRRGAIFRARRARPHPRPLSASRAGRKIEAMASVGAVCKQGIFARNGDHNGYSPQSCDASSPRSCCC